MADQRIDELTYLAPANIAANDQVPIVDKSDTTDGPGGTLKRTDSEAFREMTSHRVKRIFLSLDGIDTDRDVRRYIADAINAQGPFTVDPGQQYKFYTVQYKSNGAEKLDSIWSYYDVDTTLLEIGGVGALEINYAQITFDSTFGVAEDDNSDVFVSLGDIGASTVEDAINLGDTSESPAVPFELIKDQNLITCTISAVQKIYLFVGDSGSYGAGGLTAVAGDFYDLQNESGDGAKLATYDLKDVSNNRPTNNQVLKYNTSSGQYEPGDVSGGGSYYITPQEFGAVGDGVTDDSTAFQSMFDSLTVNGENVNVVIPAGLYLINTSLTLPTIPNGKRTLMIAGYGAELKTTAANVSIFKRMPSDQTDATTNKINANRTIIKGIHFRGDASSGGQIGIEIGATYMWRVEDCFFTQLNKGIVGTFCLSMAIENCEATNVVDNPFILQSAGDDLTGGGPVWTGGATTNSASNASVIKKCRVFGSATQHSSYTILASDLVVIESCISEGNNQGFDCYFDYQGSTTVKNQIVRDFHAESPNATVNIKAAIGGQLIVERIRRSYPAALLDLSNSLAGSSIFVKEIAYWSNMPSGSPWFYHTNGGGYGGAAGGQSTGCQWVFQNVRSAGVDIYDAANWENNTLPSSMTVQQYDGNNGYNVQSNLITFKAKTPTSNSWIDLDNMSLKSLVDDDAQVLIGKRSSTYGRPRGVYVGTAGVEALGPFKCLTNGVGVELKDNAGNDLILRRRFYTVRQYNALLVDALGCYMNMAAPISNTTTTWIDDAAAPGDWGVTKGNWTSKPTVISNAGRTCIELGKSETFVANEDFNLYFKFNGSQCEWWLEKI